MSGEDAMPARARERSVCAAPGCERMIEPGMLIARIPGGAWRHADCEQPRRGQDRAARHGQRMRYGERKQ